MERIQAAEYIAELTAELATIAKRHDLADLAQILEMAALEAGNIKAENAGTAAQSERVVEPA